MATAQMSTVIPRIRRAVFNQETATLSDSQLLESFIDRKDELAFEALVRRHGLMVMSVCRRVTRNHHDAEDAFQATFLILSRKASSIRPREMIANWLYGVAYRTARKAGAMSARRRAREEQIWEAPEREAMPPAERNDLRSLIDQELNRLPEIYRLPVLLCDLERRSIKEATQQLGWPQGTVAGRLARGRSLLAKRLANRGVLASAASLGFALAQDAASASVPVSLVSSTIKVALLGATSHNAAGVISPNAAALTERVMMTVFWHRMKAISAAAFVVLGVVGLAGGVFSAWPAAVARPSETTVPLANAQPKPQDAPVGKATIAINVRVITVPEGTRFGPDAAKDGEVAFLTDAQLKTAFDAAQDDRRVNVLCAPNVVTLDDQQAVVSISEQQMVTGVQTQKQNGQTVLVPRVAPVETGMTLTLRGKASKDERFVNVSANYTDKRLEKVRIPIAGVNGESASPPEYLETARVDTTEIQQRNLVIPPHTCALIKGPTHLEEVRTESRVPLLSEIPYLGCLFKSSGTTKTKVRVYLIVSARVIEPIEQAPMPRMK